MEQDVNIKFAVIHRSGSVVSSEETQMEGSRSGDLNVCSPPSTMVLSVGPQSDVSVIKAQLSQQLSVSANQIKLIFAGKPLDERLQLCTLNIGPETVVHAVISCKILNTENPEFVKRVMEDSTVPEVRSYFYVFCKSGCNKLQRGKLRVRCFTCGSSAVVLKEEPNCWNDVLSAPHFSCQCFGSSCADSLAEFYFKCTQCSELSPGTEVCAIPLPQVKSNTDRSQCATCGEVQNPIFEFCREFPHKICLECFIGYATISLNERRFRLTDRFGYSLLCPVSGCTGCVSDPHAFRLLGVDLYRKFQKFGTESFILGSNGVFCPKPNCGEGFLVESDADIILLVCPSCGFSFCRNCSNCASECQCEVSASASSAAADGSVVLAASDSQKSLETIRKVCKQCPRCRVKTERSGGCHHMSCCQCGFNWCWQCLREWSEECQWDHWFD